MDIKLRARLSAYSRVSEVLSTSTLATVQHSDIDTLFEKKLSNETVTDEEVSTLPLECEPADSITDIDNSVGVKKFTSENYETVSLDEIDSLFN